MELVQIQIENPKNHQKYLEDFFEEQVSFEQYINFVLGQLQDEGHRIIDIIYFPREKEVLIIYSMKI